MKKGPLCSGPYELGRMGGRPKLAVPALIWVRALLGRQKVVVALRVDPRGLHLGIFRLQNFSQRQFEGFGRYNFH